MLRPCFCHTLTGLALLLTILSIGSTVPVAEWSEDYEDGWDVTGGRYGVLSNGSIPAILLPQNHTHDLPPTPSPEELQKMEEETNRQFELLQINYTRLLDDLDGELREDLRSGRHLPRIVDKALRLFNLKQVVQEIETSVMSKVSCTACKAGVGLLQHYIRGGKTRDDIVKITYHFCVSLNIQPARVCEGITELFGGEVVYVLKRITLGPEEICSFVIGDACGDVYNPYHEWKVVFPPVPKPPVQPPESPKHGAPTFKVLHLSDTHFDPYYQEGTNADCREPLCCRLTNGPAVTPQAAAGRWGDYRHCDTPKRTVDHMLQHISSTHPHGAPTFKVLHLSDTHFDPYYQEGTNADCREPLCCRLTNGPAVTPQAAAGRWGDYRHCDTPKRTVDHMLQHISSTHPVRQVVVVVELWLLLNSTDPAKELQWFIYELQSAEFSGEKVHIIGHIPPGHSDCLKVWSRNYYHIINRYESTIAAQFFGHTHFDEFELFYDRNDLSRVINIAYIGPSVTPYTDLNPGYRIYYIDGDHKSTTRAVVDHETWVMNLKEANLYNYPIWYKLYSARSAYQMPTLMPQDWDNFLNKLAGDTKLFDLYYKHYWKNSPVRPTCNAECKKRMLCDLRSGRSHDRRGLCQELESRIDANTRTGWRAWIYNGLALSYVNYFTGFCWIGASIKDALTEE
ncbi:hypothetical protein C0J52_15302 [Blattella germanica]|nr:hypothetical protein C0J52_15302 [Blattella germanica]